MNFQGITHILKCGSKDKPVYVAVGSVPLSMMVGSKPTREDIMAGRVHGELAYKQMVFDSPEEWFEHAVENRVNVCELPQCACRTLLDSLQEAYVNRLVAMAENEKERGE